MTDPEKTPRLYSDLAELWPLLSPPEDYEAEAQTLREIIDEHFTDQPEQRRTILELGAGGGHTLHHFMSDFDCAAADVSPAMLEQCKTLNPGIETIVDDMRTMRLDRVFDVVLLHDAVDYMTNETDARAAVATVAAHLAPGGIAIIAPTYTRETFQPCEAEHDQRADLQTERVLTYLSYAHDPDPNDTQFQLLLVYLIDDGERTEVIEDRHTCGLFTEADWIQFIKAANLTPRPTDDHVPAALFIATH